MRNCLSMGKIFINEHLFVDVGATHSQKILRKKFSIYIIIRPIAVDEEVPEHHDPDREGESEIFGKKLCIKGELPCQSIKDEVHGRLYKMQNGDADEHPRDVDGEEHCQLPCNRA